MEYVLHPRSEIDARIRKLQDRMGELTGVIIFESTDLGYFSGTAQEGLIYIPRDGQPTLMIKKSQDRAGQESPLPVQPQRSLRSLKADLNLPAGARIGLELDVLPYNNYLRLEKALGEDIAFFDISETIKHIRSVKSDFELRLIREAARILDAGIATVADNLKEGMREIDLAVAVESTMRVLGHQGIVAFRRFNQNLPLGHLMAGPSAALPSSVSSPTGGRGMSLFFAQGPGFARIKRGESVLVDYAGCYNGYIADETRIFCVGKISAKLEDAHQAALQIEEAIAEQLSPGKMSRDIWNLSEAEGERLGYRDFLGGPPGSKAGFVGHGVGLQIDEYPVLGPLDHEIVESMVVAVEPKMIYPGEGVVGIEDTFLVGETGAERLTRLPQEIWRV
ncbi:MAG: Xaa-Pro dipeptidase [Methanosaeta sp. PtaU1.Bin112]|nr:MAG: Xaa-Pro dipeptidase [Methanosaeta sp. PtaU1.Bin112]